jgi:hypothetical protein
VRQPIEYIDGFLKRKAGGILLLALRAIVAVCAVPARRPCRRSGIGKTQFSPQTLTFLLLLIIFRHCFAVIAVCILPRSKAFR